MAEELKKEKDEIVEDIEASLTEVESGYRFGYRMIIHPNGLVEIATGELAMYPVYGNPHYSCCCSCG